MARRFVCMIAARSSPAARRPLKLTCAMFLATSLQSDTARTSGASRTACRHRQRRRRKLSHRSSSHRATGASTQRTH
eukprot:11190987-Lingulodinium_polyedra.AAC.1